MRHVLSKCGSASLPAVVVASSLLCGCASPPAKSPVTRYQTLVREPNRDPERARRENERAVTLMDKGDHAAAEAALKAALAADDSCGPAHNNLGKVYLHLGKAYLAAWEFELAAKLMPNHVEPPNNLGLLYEVVTRDFDKAVQAYEKALSVDPESIEAMGNLARTRVRRGDRGADLRALLEKLLLRETRPDWLAWEKGMLTRLRAAEAPAP